MGGNVEEFYIDIPQVEKMRGSFEKAALELDNAIGEVNKIVAMLNNHGLLGDGGSSLVEALQTTLTRKVTEVRDKCEEMSRDLQAAIKDAQAADTRVRDEIGQ